MTGAACAMKTLKMMTRYSSIRSTARDIFVVLSVGMTFVASQVVTVTSVRWVQDFHTPIAFANESSSTQRSRRLNVSDVAMSSIEEPD